LEPSEFQKYCGSDSIGLAFPRQFLTGGPGGGSSSSSFNSSSGGSSSLEQWATFASTSEEAAEMMRKFSQELQKAAEEKGCKIENLKLENLSPKEDATHFSFTYAVKGNNGELSVTRTNRTEKEYLVPGKQVYTVKLVVNEKIGKTP
jgi:hypothetical protein